MTPAVEAAAVKPIYYRDHMIVPADPRLAVMIPHAKSFVDNHSQQALMLIPHRLDECTILRNIGFEVTSPVMLSYDWAQSNPYDAQRITTALIVSNRRSYVLNGLGTGKTRAALYAQDYMKKSVQGHGAMLAVCPLSTTRQTWEREVALNFPHMKVAVLTGDRQRRLKLLAGDYDVFVINHDGVETIDGALLEAVTSGRISYMVLDELTVYKNATTKLFKSTFAIAQAVGRLTGMTATPMTKDASGAYGQIKLVTPGALNGMSFTRFREQVQTKVSQFRWVNRRDALETIYQFMQPSVRFTRDDCYDIPDAQYIDVEVPLSKQQEAMFHELVTDSAVPSMNVTTANAADVGNKCLQVVTGAVYDADRVVIDVPSAPRLEELERYVEASEAKVIVFVPYKHSGKKVLDYLTKAGYECAEVNGDVSPAQRERIFTRFMQTPDLQVLVAHPKCMSHGLTLTEASTIIWYGLPDSLETYEQANGRITRAGQRLKQLIIRLVSTQFEKRRYKQFDSQADDQDALLSLFESQDLGALL